MLRDQNSVPFTSLDSFEVVTVTPSAFAGGTTNARGDEAGTSDPLTLFTVTGDVLVRLFGVVTVDLVSAGGGTLQVGVVADPDLLLAVSTATDLDANDIYSVAGGIAGGDALSDVTGPFVIVNGQDIVESVGTADI